MLAVAVSVANRLSCCGDSPHFLKSTRCFPPYIQVVMGLARLVPALLYMARMKHETNLTILTHVSTQISQGRPLWALLWANQYWEKESPLRQALVMKARLAMADDRRYAALGQALQNIIDGATMQELNPEEKELVVAFRESSAAQSRALAQKETIVPLRGKRFASVVPVRQRVALRARRA